MGLVAQTPAQWLEAHTSGSVRRKPPRILLDRHRVAGKLPALQIVIAFAVQITRTGFCRKGVIHLVGDANEIAVLARDQPTYIPYYGDIAFYRAAVHGRAYCGR